jgi:RimJ/RimL family protein N-acetyltransferase
MTLGVRPADAGDLDRLHEWRNAERVRQVSLTDGPIDFATHEAWFARVLAEGRPLFVAELDGVGVGVIRLDPNVDDPSVVEWSCHLGTAPVPPGFGAALPIVGIGLGFRGGARRMVADVLGINRNMRSIHRRLGVPEEGVRRAHVVRASGEFVDLHQYGVLVEEWGPLLERALPMLPSRLRADVAAVAGTDASGSAG